MPLGRNGKNTNVNPKNAARYVRNVGRSLGYATIDALTNTAPTIKELFASNKDTVESLYQEIKDFASSPLDKLRSNEKLMSYSNDIKTGFTNLKDDIKTGNFYNMERQNASTLSMMGLDDEDIFGDIDFDSDLKDLNSSSSDVEIASKEIEAMDDIGSRISTSVSMATAKSAEYIVAANAESTRAIINQTSHIFNTLSSGLLGVNKTLGSIAQLAQPLTAHMQNASVFYTESTKNQEKMIELLTTIAENTKRPEVSKAKRKELNGLEYFLGSDYSFNLSSMGSMIKKNAKEAFENSALGMLAEMNSMMGEGTSMTSIIASNPIGFAMPFLLEGMMTKKLKDSLKKLSDSLGAFNIKLIRDLSNLRKSPNSILSFIGELFRFDDKNKEKRDTGEYEKGAISFDGVTKHAIVRVIPEYLGMILSAISGQPQTRYDYKAGKFITKASIRKEQKKEFNREVDSIGFEARMEAENIGEKEADVTRIKKSINAYISNALREGNYIDPRVNYSDAVAKERFGLTKTQMDDVKALIAYYEKTGQFGEIEKLNMSIREARSARATKVTENPYLSNEDYLFDNGFTTLKNAAGFSGSLIAPAVQPNGTLTGDESEQRIIMYLISKGYTSKDKEYKKYVQQYKSIKSPQKRANLIKKLNELPNAAEARAARNIKNSNISESTEFSTGALTGKESIDDISKYLISKGYEKDSKTYKKYLQKFRAASSPEQIKDITEELNKLKKASEPKSKKGSSIIGRFLRSEYDEEDDYVGVRSLITVPMNFLADQLDKASSTLYDIMYGKDGDKDDEHSIVGAMLNHMKDIFTKFKDFLKENIMDPIKGYFEERGGIVKMITDFFGIEDVDGFKGYLKGKAKDIAGNVGANFKSAAQWALENSPIVNAAKARKAKINAKRTSIRINQTHNQRGFAPVQVSSYSDFGNTAPIDEEENYNYLDAQFEDEEDYAQGSRLRKMFARGSGLRRFRGGRTAQETVEGTKGQLKDFLNEDSFAQQTKNEVGSALKAFFSRIVPDGKDGKEEYEKVSNVVKTSAEEIGADPSGAITGAIMGTGVSLLTGGFISPILAASLGAAAGLTIKSNAVQDLLFGPMTEYEDPETHEIQTDRMGGVFSKEVSDFMRKQLPGMAAWGTTGAVVSLIPGIPGGPLAGMLVGSALSFAHKSEKVQEFLWGNEEENGLLGSKEDRENKLEWLKKMAPKATAGAVLGMIAGPMVGPFGLVGSAFAGAALGFASETELFKQYIFGKKTGEIDAKTGEEKREGGITGWIKKDIISPVAEAIKPITVEIKNKGKDIIRWTVRSIASVFKAAVAVPLFSKINDYFLKPLAGTVIPGVAKLIGKVVSAPFKAVGALGRGLRKKQIRTGRANDMSAKARLQYRSDYALGDDEFVEFDTTLAGMETEDIDTMIREINAARKSGDQELIDQRINEFSTKFGLQNKNVNNKNIDKWLDTVKAEAKNRDRSPEAIQLDLDKVRNMLMESHYNKIENMIGHIANKILKQDLFEVTEPGNIEEAKAEGGATPKAIKNTRRNAFNVLRSLNNPFVGMDMPSVKEAINFYEDSEEGTPIPVTMEKYNELKQRVRKVEVDGVLRDDVIQVTDKNGYTVTVKKVSGSWVPYKPGEQLIEALGMTKIVSNVKMVGRAVSGVATGIARAISGYPFWGIDQELAKKVARAYLAEMQLTDDIPTDAEKALLNKYGTILNDKYPGEYVLRIDDDKGRTATGRFDLNTRTWKVLDVAWLAKQTGKRIVRGFKNTVSNIKNKIQEISEVVKHYKNPFCDFEWQEIPAILDDLNAMEFGNGGSDTGRVERVPGLKHYYRARSTNGTVVTVTVKNGKWSYVSNKELSAAQARTLTSGWINAIGNKLKARFSRNLGYSSNRERGLELANRQHYEEMEDLYNGAEEARNEHEPFDPWEEMGQGSRLRKMFGKGSRLRKMFGRGALTGAFIGAGSQFSLFGALKTKIAKDGQEIIDTQDKESRATLKIRDNFINKFNDIADYVKGIFKEVSETTPEDAEKKEEKKSLFDKIFGESGWLGNISNWIKNSLPTLIGGAAILGFSALSMSGKLDSLMAKLGLGGRDTKNQSTDSGTSYTQWSGTTSDGKTEAVATDENGNPIMDENGNYISTNGNVLTDVKSIYGNTNAMWSQKMIGNTARSVVTGSGVVAKGLSMVNKATGKIGTKVASKVGKFAATKVGEGAAAIAAKGLGDVAEEAAGDVIFTQLDDQIFKLFNALKKVKFLKGFAGALDEMASSLSSTIAKKLGGKAAAEVGKQLLSFAAFAAKIALIAWDFEEGYNSAMRTLGIKEPTTGQRILSGIIRAVKNLIPIVGSLIPDKVVVDLFVKILAPLFGINVSEFLKAQDEAQQELDEYNRVNGTDLSWDEYVKQEGLESTWGENIVNGVKGVGAKIKSGATKVKNGVMKFSSGVVDGAKKLGSTVTSTAKDMIESRKKIDKMILAGDLKGLAGLQYRDEKDEDQGNIVGKMFFHYNKFFAFIPTGISWITHKAFDGFKKIIGDIKEDASSFMTRVSNMKSMSQSSDDGVFAKVKNIWTSGAGEYKSGLGRIFSIADTISKVIFTLASVAKLITDPVASVINGLKTKAQNVVNGVKEWLGDKAEAAGEWIENTKQNIADAWDKAPWNSGSGSFVSQLDPRVAGKRFGSSTIGANGCAPSVASMLTGYDLGTTAGMATSGGYANSAGTSADYFGKVLGSAGIPAEYVYTGAGSAQDYLAGRIASGSPTVLLGQDPYNTSKAYSPFGPGNHYVLATGMTNNGGVVVQDPESSRPNMVYDKSILNSVKLGIPTGGRSGLRRARRLRGGAFVEGTDTHGSTGTVTSTKVTPETTNKYVEPTAENYAYENLGSFSMPTASELNAWIKKKRPDSPFVGNAQIFINASKESGLDPRYILAHAAVESAWGTSNQAINKRNYFGIGSFDTNPSNAYTMGNSMANGIIEGAKWIAKHYYHGKYGQTCIYKMRYNNNQHQYCTSDTWVGSIAQLMSSMPKNTKLSLVEGVMSSITGALSTLASNGASNQEDASASSSGKSLGESILNLGSMFGDLFSSAFGGLGKLFGLSSSSEEENNEMSSGEEDAYNYNPSSSEYSDGVVGNASSKNNFPYFNQGSNPWGSMMYSSTNDSSQTMTTSGCGPTSMAMVLKSYNKNYDPMMTAQYSMSNGFRTANSGTSWGFFKSLGDKEGLTTEQFADPSMVTNYLSKGIPVIASMGPGYFTKHGHYVVLSGMQDGNLLVNDPSSQDRTNKVWDLSSSLSQGKQFWAISQDGVGSIGKFGSNSSASKADLQAARKGMSAAGSGIAGYNIAQDAYNVRHRKHRSANSVFGAGSKIVNLSGYSDTRKAKYVSNLISNMRASGSATNDEVLVALLKAMITLLSNMSTNSDKINTTLGSISSIVESMSMSGNAANMNINEARKGIGVSDTDSTLAELQSLLDSIASGA